MAIARDVYGVWPETESTGITGEEAENTGAYDQTYPVVDFGVYDQPYSAERGAPYGEYAELSITDEVEIRELLELISYSDGRSYTGGAFRTGIVDYVSLVLSGEKEKEIFSVYIPFGALPEKYILRFGTLQD